MPSRTTPSAKKPSAAPAKKPSRKPAPLRDSTLHKLAASDLSAEDAELMQLRDVTSAECAGLGLPASADGFLIPYFGLDGRQTRFFRVRYMEDTRKGFARFSSRKALRYGQPKGTATEVYFPPFLDWEAISRDADTPLLITEGELKSCCASKQGLPTIGLGGVWCFQSAKSGSPLLDSLLGFQWNGRTVYIVFDSDAITNPDVLGAEKRLAARLVEQGATVFIARLPGHEDVQKIGLDDYIVLHGVDSLQKEVLEPAFEYEQSAALHELNVRCIYVRDPGLVWDREMRQRMTPSAFRDHAFANVHYWEQRVTAKGAASMVKLPAAKAWIEWEHRAECRGLTFAPTQPEVTHEGHLNTWTGWGIPEPIAGNAAPWKQLLDHLFGEDEESRRWFEAWCAYPLQNPGAKMATAALIWGVTHGSGKTLVGHTLMRIYGKHAVEIHDSDLEDDRNEWALDKQFVLGDDIVAKGDRKLMRHLMTLITQKSVRLNPKYVPSYSIPDTINYYYTANEPDTLYMDDGDRRFFVHETMAGKFTDYKRYVEWRDSDRGIAALWHHLLELDITWFDPQAPAPETRGKSEMQELGKSDLGHWVREFRENAVVVLEKHGMKGDFVTAPELHALFDPTGAKKTTVNALARELKRAGFRAPATGSKLRGPDGSMRMCYVVRNWAKWQRATWKEACDHYGESRPHLTAKRKF